MFLSTRGKGRGASDIWTIDAETGDLQQWTDSSVADREPTWSPDGTEIAYVTTDSVQKIEAVNEDGSTRTLISAEDGETLHSPSWSPNEEDIAYIRGGSDPEGLSPSALMVSEEQVTDREDVFIFTPDWLSSDELLYSADGVIRVLELSSNETSEVPFSATFHLPEIDYDRKSYFDDEGGGT